MKEFLKLKGAYMRSYWWKRREIEQSLRDISDIYRRLVAYLHTVMFSCSGFNINNWNKEEFRLGKL